MQRENVFLNDGYAAAPGSYAMHHQDQSNELNGGGFFHTSWENSISIDQSDPFESALSSMVSSPTASNSCAAAGTGNGENMVLRELIGRLGSICNSGEISPQPHNRSANTSCYSTPLSSPPKLNLSSIMENQIRGKPQIPGSHFPGLPNLVAPFSADPGFAERAARLSCFANNTAAHRQLTPNLDSAKISRVSSNPSMKISGSPPVLENAELGESRENSSVSQQIPGVEVGPNSRKRKSVPKGKGKEILPKDANVAASENSESSAKRSKSDDGSGNEKDDPKAELLNQKKDSKDNQKPPEPPKDYIHVRARRGQATDAHSLAERVRREKISERMKVLQDLVPGCNKVTGKAVMLDEIINYVQSLQRQVEFLSMKLATVNPRMEFNAETLVSKDMFRSNGLLPQNVYTSDGYLLQSQPNFTSLPNGTEAPFPPNHYNARNQTLAMPGADTFSEATSQVLTSWEDDLHSVVQMGYNQNQAQNFHGIPPTAQMKVEL